MPALILMYHDVAENCDHVSPEHRPYVLDPASFRLQMKTVAAQQLAVLTVNQWCASSREQRAIVLTFDDGHVSNYELVMPILLEHRLKGTFFITAGYIGTGEIMSWEQIRALHAAGMEIGSHTVTHRPPSTLDDKALRYELLESRRILEDGLSATVTSVSSPTGFFNPRMSDIAKEVGYHALCFGQAGLAADDGNPFSLNRVAVKRTMSEKDFNSVLRFDSRTIRRIRFKQLVRERARHALGLNSYLRIRRLLTERGLSW